MKNRYRIAYITLIITALAVLSLAGMRIAAAQDDPTPEAEVVTRPDSVSPFHPEYALLDANGESVLASGEPVSTMKTCGECHDTAFITEHSFHTDVGLAGLSAPGDVAGGQPWDFSPGLFGKWNPLTYRYLSPAGDERIDLTTAAWIQFLGARHVGGGPAVTGRDSTPLTELTPDATNLDASIVDPASGEPIPWDWQQSGVVEMNCFLCHTPDPNNDARTEALASGDFRWANTATLLGSGIVENVGDEWQWNPDAFDAEGMLQEPFVNIQDPTNENCGQCHGLVHVDAQTPLNMNTCTAEYWNTITTGQIISPQRISSSGLNLSGKDMLSRSWDVHAERVVGCTDCHYSLNNPIYYRESDDDRPNHLTFDPRRIDLGEYLLRPSHQFAKGESAQGTLAPELDNTLRRCESCHSIEATHDWLPYKEQHTQALSCESCHVPKLYAPSRQSLDWTVLAADRTPQTECRGIEGEVDAGDTFGTPLIDSYEPVLLPRQNGDGTTSLAPHNLISAWYWVYDDPPRPVPLRDLETAWFNDDGEYHDDIIAAFDENSNGIIDDDELIVDNERKGVVVAGRLQALGLDNPRIMGEVRPYSINHDVAYGAWATKECSTCHGEDSRITQPLLLSGQVPGGVMPALISDQSTALRGNLYTAADGALYYRPQTKADAGSDLDSLYILGHNNVSWIDWFGAIVFLGTLVGASAHGGLRYFAMRRRTPSDPEVREVYMYSMYERLWHWLQTLVIFGLLFTGLIIHKPEQFGIFSFRYVVEVHNVLAAILVINAALSAFYHLASGEIQQFLPRPRGFFDQTFTQAKFYLQGIFRGEEHPFEKTPQRKLNPLQQITYFGLLNVLLPAQIITGALMWGMQRWPDVAAGLGGLPVLAPVHTIVAWLFASFIVMHVYLTTTGHTATANIKAMIMGWDEVEVHGQVQSTEAKVTS